MTDAQIINSIIEACPPEKLAKLVAHYGYDDEEITPQLLNEIYLEHPDFASQLADITNTDQLTPVLNNATGDAPFYDLNGKPVYDLSSVNKPLSSGQKTKWTASEINDTIKISTGFASDMLSYIFPDKYKYNAQAAMAMTELERIKYDREFAQSQKNAVPWVWIIIVIFILIVAALYFSNKKK